MEGLDTAFTTKIQQHMKHADRTKVFSSTQYNASQMASVLRSLDLLITSRYHAGVLSLPHQVPQTAIGHDLRIKDLYTDLGTPELFVDHEDPDRYKILSDNVETLFNQYSTIRSQAPKRLPSNMKHGKKETLSYFRAFLEANYPGVVKLKTILLTGANGFIATQIARNLLADEEVTILALVRANDTASCSS